MDSVCEERRDECCGECVCNEPVQLTACIRRVCRCELLVCDLCTSQEVLVHTPEACCFCVGEHICIEYTGAMTMSIPPQINACRITRLGGHGCGCCRC